MTFPIICRGGGVCAFEASAGGRASRVGARFAQVKPRTEVWKEGSVRGSVAPILPRGLHIYVQESRPHAVRDPVTMQGRDLRIGARAWAGAAR